MRSSAFLLACSFYFILLTFYAVASFALTDPNLVLTSWPPFWNFQQWMWQTFFLNRQLLTSTFGALFIGMFASYLCVVRAVQQQSPKQIFLISLVFAFPLLLSYNALSHDVFNYIFNAKMAVIYHANPHQHVALDFAQDTWTRFMHNTHTPAPYGYGWTLFSLIPFLLGVGKFTFTWLLFRLTSVLSLAVLFFSLQQFLKQDTKSGKKFALLFFNPLLLIEVVSNSHNDLWMIAPAILGFSLVLRLKNKLFNTLFDQILISAGLLLFSISVKLATVTLLPFWAILVAVRAVPMNNWVGRPQDFLKRNLPLLCSLCLFLLLLTPRSQQFHPWYLVWILAWLPLIKQRFWTYGVVILSASSLLRYLPWIWAGGFSPLIIQQQKMITWIPLLVFSVSWLTLRFIKPRLQL